MDNATNHLESIFESAEAYGKTTLELIKLRSLQISTSVISSVLAQMVVFAILFMCVLVISVGIAFLLGQWLHNVPYGFLIVGGGYLIGGVLAHLFLPQWIRKRVTHAVLKATLEPN